MKTVPSLAPVLATAALLAALLAALPVRLLAVDGVTLIDQARALAGNITAGDGPGFPITISQPGSYRLSGPITVPNAGTTAFQVTSPYVTIDLNGFSISGPTVCQGEPLACQGTGAGVGVSAGSFQAPGPAGVRVVNGTIRGMGSEGLALFGLGSSAERVSVDSNGGLGMLVDGVAIHCLAIHNGRTGILAVSTVESVALENVGNGIQVDGGGGVAIGNVASRNGGHGLLVSFGTATGNTAVRNHLAGVSAVCPSSLANNTLVMNLQGSLVTAESGCSLSNIATPLSDPPAQGTGLR